MHKISLIFATSLLLFFVSASQAEVISITDPRYDVPNAADGVLRPTQGMDMKSVEAKFGAPVQKNAAVGDPPITRWIYPKFEVFFEYDKVIHSVVKHEK